MSRSTLTAIAGATIGFFVGGVRGAQIGWAVGSFLGAEGPGDSQGPRLNDLQAENIDYGADIPIVYGRARIAGFRMWQRDIREQENEEDSGSKGGGGATVTTFTYYGTFAIALCEGPIAGVRKIWADSNLIYNVGATSSLETIQASNRAAEGIRIYLGTDSQLPDSLIQATQGSANTPAYRNTAYIVFDDLALEKYGNRIPNITVEVIGAGSIDNTKVYDRVRLNMPYIAVPKYVPVYGKNGIFTLYGGFNPSSVDPETGYTSFDNEYLDTFLADGRVLQQQSEPLSIPANVGDDYVLRQYPSGGASQSKPIGVLGGSTVYLKPSIASPIVIGTTSGAILPWGVITDATSSTAFGANGDLVDKLIEEGETGRNIYCATGDLENNYVFIFTGAGGNADKWFRFGADGEIDGSGAISPAVTASTIPFLPFYFGAGLNREIQSEPDGQGLWQCSVGSGNSINSFFYSIDGNDVMTRVTPDNDIGSPTLSGDIDDFHIFVENKVCHVHYRDDGNDNYYITSIARGDFISASAPTLSTIVSDICTRAGLEAGEIDVTELTDTVEGYIISRNMSARAAIEPLQRAFLFDGAEIDGKIKFIKRGKSSVVTIPQDDLGAADLGSDVPQLTTTRQQDSELPSEVTVSYISDTRDYETGSQPSQRVNHNVQNVVTQNLPIVMSDDRGVQLADITLYNAWTEREKFNFTLTNEYIARNPTDVVTVVYGSESRIVRLTKISYGDWLECEAVAEDATVYTSTATAEDDDFTDQVVGLAGPTRVEYMDAPLLRNQDNGAGLYCAACGYFSAWTGSQIFKSLDSGITYNPVSSTFTAATIGSASNTLASADPELWDRTSTLTVRLANGTFSSTTEDGAIQGSNLILAGSECLNFVNATLNADGSYTLDTFIRGRRGTEWAVGTHSSGEAVVLLNESTLERFDAIIGTARTYKAVTLGTFIDEAEAESVTNTGINLKPFSPALISGTRDGSNNLTGDFTRRSRYIAAPLWTPPLFEDSESYEVDIMSGATVLRTIATSTTDFSYTAAQQTSDGLTPGDPVEVNIYQLSGTVGRGYAGNATI